MLVPLRLNSRRTGRRQAHHEVLDGRRSIDRSEHPATLLPLLLAIQHPFDLPGHPRLVRQGRGDQGQAGRQQRKDPMVSEPIFCYGGNDVTDRRTLL